MKKVLATIALSALFAAPAMAADMPVKATPIAVAAAVYNWSGLYIGANGGFARGDVRRTDDAGGVLNSYSASSGLFGGQGGWRWQSGRLVFGVEVSGAFTNIDANANCPNPAFVCHTRIRDLFLGGGQLGLAWSQALLYVSGGFASTETNTFSVPAFAGFASTSRHNGAFIGVGFDMGISNNWTFGAEYIHAEFQSRRYADPAGGNIPYTIRPTIDLVRAKVSYRFGGPVVARY